MRASVSSEEIANAKISCSERSLKFLATAFSLTRMLFFAQRRIGVAEGAAVAEEAGIAEGTSAVVEEAGVTEGDAEGAGVVATRTIVPVVRESDGLTITLSDSVTPLRISDCTQKSRPTLTSRSCTPPLASTTPTCRFLPRNISVLSGKISSFAKALCGTRTVA